MTVHACPHDAIHCRCSGVNVVANAGSDAGQVVFHTHFHVIPRFSDDKLIQLPASAKEMITGDKAKEVLAKLQAHV